MIYKLITWIEIYFVSLQLLSGGVKGYSFHPYVTFNSVNHRRNKLIYI